MVRPVCAQLRDAILHIVMREKYRPRLTRANSSMHAGMDQRVGDDKIVDAHQRWRNTQISEISAAEHASGLGAFQTREPIFDPANERHRV